MEVSDRLRALQELQRVRAELNDARATLQTLLETAWPEETENKDASCRFKVTLATDVDDAKALADLASSDCCRPRIPTTEEEMKAFIQRGVVLVCTSEVGGAGDADTGNRQYCGCCAVAGPSNVSSELPLQDSSAPSGQLVFIAVKQVDADGEAIEQADVAKELLAAAEDLLAGEHQCGEVRLKFDTETLSGPVDEDCAYQWLQHSDYTPSSTSAVPGIILTKTLALGFVCRSLARRVTAREQALSAQLESLQAQESLSALAATALADVEVQLQESGELDEAGAVAPGCDMLTPLPHDVCAAILRNLGVQDTGAVAQICRIFAQEASDNDVWQRLFVQNCWPPSDALLAFAEDSVDTPGGIDWRSRVHARAKASPVIVVDVGRGYTKYGIVHGLHGRPEGDGHAPHLVQLCSSPTHPPDCDHDEQLPFIHSQIDAALLQAAANPEDQLHRVALCPSAAAAPAEAPGRFAVLSGLTARDDLNGTLVRLESFEADKGRWKVCPVNVSQRSQTTEIRDRSNNTLVVLPERLRLVNRAHEFPLLIGEPFAATAGGAGGRSRGGLTRWALATQADLGSRPGPVRIIPQAQMALWAHGIDHGIVVNIGQGQTFALPVVCGEIVAPAAVATDVGSAALTRLMVQVLHQRYPFVDGSVMTWCRDLKENYCYVAPPVPSTTVKGVTLATEPGALRRRLSLGDDYGVQQVRVQFPITGDMIELDKERILVPEALFDPGMVQGEATLPMLILRCAEKVLALGLCGQEALQALLRNIVLVGGAADLPGIRPRTEFELRALLEHRASQELRSALRSPEDVFVLNPPLGAAGPLTSPRFVPFFGGCVRMASSRLPSTGIGVQDCTPPHFGERGRNGSPAEDTTADQHLPNRSIVIPNLAAWMRRRFFHLNAPAIFRTGGGGGEDEVWGRAGWQALGDLTDSDSDSEHTEQVPQEEPIGPHVEQSSSSTNREMVDLLLRHFRNGVQVQSPPQQEQANNEPSERVE